MNRQERRALDLVMVGGVPVERDALRIAEKVNEYDPNLRVQILSEAMAVNEPPFRIVESCRDGIDRVVFSCWQLDNTVIERIYAADNAKHDVQTRLEKNNEKARKSEVRRYKDRLAEAHEVAHAVIKSPKSTYTFKDANGKIHKFS